MKLFVLFIFACYLCSHGVEGQVHCCSYYLDIQMTVNAYIGVANLNILPDTPPEAYTGKIRQTKLTTEGLEISEYEEFNLPGFETLSAVVGDFRNPPKGVFYDIYTNGTCIYTEYENIGITPPCAPAFWPKLEDFSLGFDYKVDRYGTDVDNNYLIVQSEGCVPIIQFATRRNAPSEGLYRFNSEMYTNVEPFFGEIEVPEKEDCIPATASYIRPPTPQPFGSPFVRREKSGEKIHVKVNHRATGGAN